MEPQAETLREVVEAKLAAPAVGRGYLVVEDSGLFIPSLHGFPGVYSAHILRIWGFEPILELLKARNRRAYFETVVGVGLGNRRWLFGGKVAGRIATRASGHHGFGFDPIFVPRGWDRTLADASPGEKNEVSHRARAFRKVGRFLEGARNPTRRST